MRRKYELTNIDWNSLTRADRVKGKLKHGKKKRWFSGEYGCAFVVFIVMVSLVLCMFMTR